jgi:hypothetical protein
LREAGTWGIRYLGGDIAESRCSLALEYGGKRLRVMGRERLTHGSHAERIRISHR